MNQLAPDLLLSTAFALLEEARDSVEFERVVRGKTDKDRSRSLGGLLGRIDAELAARADVQWRRFESAPREFTGLVCSVCKEPQFKTPGGDSCAKGHGGAPGVEPAPGEGI